MESGGKKKSPRRSGLDAISGAIAGMVSRFVVGPLDVIKIRFQVQVMLRAFPPHLESGILPFGSYFEKDMIYLCRY